MKRRIGCVANEITLHNHSPSADSKRRPTSWTIESLRPNRCCDAAFETESTAPPGFVVAYRESENRYLGLPRVIRVVSMILERP